jgi:hypothetical protein
MKVIVRQLCAHGTMLSDRDIAAAPQTTGMLQMFLMDGRSRGRQCIRLCAIGNQVADDLLPRLWEPVLEGLGHNIIRIRGLQAEHDKGKALHLQIWLCQVVA